MCVVRMLSAVWLAIRHNVFAYRIMWVIHLCDVENRKSHICHQIHANQAHAVCMLSVANRMVQARVNVSPITSVIRTRAADLSVS